MNKNVTLENVNLSYDHTTGCVVVKSKDKRIKGKPFKITIGAHSESYKTLIELLEKEKAINTNEVTIPTRIDISNPLELEVEDKDPRYVFKLGESFGKKQVELDIRVSPNTLIAGNAGSGVPILQRNIIAHAFAHEEIQMWAIDLSGIEIASKVYKYREQDKIAKSLDEAVLLALQLSTELERRYEILERMKKNNVRELEESLPTIYFMVDNHYGHIFSEDKFFTKDATLSSNEEKLLLLQKTIGSVLRLGRAGGIRTFVCTPTKYARFIPGESKANLDNRILMGGNDNADSVAVLGTKSNFGGSLTNKSGRGILRVYSEPQELFETYYLSPDAMKN